MTKKKDKLTLDGFLEKAKAEKCTCPFCKDPVVSRILEDFMKKKESGETSISLNYLYEHFLIPDHDVSKNQKMLYSHVRRCLGRNPSTGRLFSEEEK